MESLPEPVGPLSTEAYLAFEQTQPIRHEFVDGWVYAMVGASDRHEDIAMNLAAALHAHLAGRPCRVYKGDLKLRVGDDFFYPDVFVRCGDRPDDKFYRTDPVMIAEVLSPSRRRYDERDKLATYRAIDSLQDYLLIEQDLMHVVIHRTGQDEPIELTRPDDTIELPAIGFSMTLAALYA